MTRERAREITTASSGGDLRPSPIIAPPPLPLVWGAMNGHHYGHCNYTVVSDCCWSEAADQKEWIHID